MQKQYVYIFSNPRQPELIKVGETKLHPEVRANQLSRQTGSVGKWEVQWYMVVPDSILAEKMAHYLLNNHKDSKEYFKISISDASIKLEQKLPNFFDIKKTEIWNCEKKIEPNLSPTKNLESEKKERMEDVKEKLQSMRLTYVLDGEIITCSEESQKSIEKAQNFFAKQFNKK